MLDAVCIGAANVDLIVYVDKFPSSDQETEIKRMETLGGGSAANIAVGISRLGRASGFVGKVGTDKFGDFLIKEFRKENVDISNLKIQDGNSGMVLCIVNKNGDRTLYALEGVQETLRPVDMPKEYIQNSGFLCLASVMGKDTIKAFETASQYAKDTGVKVFFDLGYLFAEKGIGAFTKLLENTDILKMNSEEAKIFYHNSIVFPL